MHASVDVGRVLRVVEAALQLPPPARAQWLDTHCGADAGLRREVEALLARDGAAAVETAELLSGASLEDDPHLARVFGHFRTCAYLGSGGMGVVYRAERLDGIKQTVALKLLRSAPVRGVRERFGREMRTLARLDHPAVARLIDAGVAEDATPWFAMEYVDGEPIDVWCDTHRLPLLERVRLLVQLADAVDAAHRMFVVHRDIKPSNVLVREDGSPKLIDFGIAKVLDEDADEAQITRGGAALFTPQYAAPEQVLGAPITVAADVFGLGALGYRLLSGRTLFPDAGSAPLPYMLAITQRDVVPASRAASAAGAKDADVRALRGDLEAILARALARDPAQRYAGAADLRDELRAYLEHRPVRARRPTMAYRAGKFIRRNAVASALAMTVLIGTAVGAVALGWQARQVALQRDAARLATQRAQRINDFLVTMLQASDPGSGGRRDVTVSEVLDAAAKRSASQLADDPSLRGQILETIALTDYQLGRYAPARVAIDDAVPLLSRDPADYPKLAQALEVQGAVLRDLGDLPKAAAAIREEIALLGTLSGMKREEAVASKALGMILQRDGQTEEALSWYRRALDIFRARRLDDPEYADTLISLGEALQTPGNFDESLAVEQQGLAMSTRMLPADNPGVLGARIAVAEALQSVGRLAEAEAIHRQLVADRTRVLGPQHLDTLISRLSLSGNLRMQHHDAEAIELARDASNTLQQVAGSGHRTVAYGLSMLALAECLGGQAQDGLVAAEQAQRIRGLPPGSADRRAVLGRLIAAICRDRVGEHLAAASAIEAENSWRTLGSGSYADVPGLAASIVDRSHAQR